MRSTQKNKMIKDLLEREISVGDYVVTRKTYSESDLQLGRVVKLHNNGKVSVVRVVNNWDDTIKKWFLGLSTKIGTFDKGSRLCLVAEQDVPQNLLVHFNQAQLDYS